MNIVTLSVIIFQYLFIEISTTRTLLQKKLGIEIIFPFGGLQRLPFVRWFCKVLRFTIITTQASVSSGLPQPSECLFMASWLNPSDFKLLDLEFLKHKSSSFLFSLLHHLPKWTQTKTSPYLRDNVQLSFTTALSISAIHVGGRNTDLW